MCASGLASGRALADAVGDTARAQLTKPKQKGESFWHVAGSCLPEPSAPRRIRTFDLPLRRSSHGHSSSAPLLARARMLGLWL
jgi:hypothetical protein